MIFFNAKSYQECGLDHIRVVIKFENEGGSVAKNKYSGVWESVQNIILDKIESTLDIKDGTKILKNTTFGYDTLIKYLNGLEIQYHSKYKYMGVMIEFHGEVLRYFRSIGLYDLKLLKLLNSLTFDDLDGKKWIVEARRIDVAIDYFNYGFTVHNLAVKLTQKHTLCVYYDHYDRSSCTYHERISRAEVYAHMNHYEFNTIYVGRPGGSFQIRIYNKIVESEENGRSVPCGVDSWVRSELVMNDDLAISFFNSSVLIDDDKTFMSLIYKFQIKKMKLKQVKTGNYHLLTKDMMKRADDVEILEYSKAKPKDLFLSKYQHIINGSGLVAFVQTLQEIERRKNLDNLVDNFFMVVKDIASEKQPNSDLLCQWKIIFELIDDEYNFPFDLESR